MGIHISRASHEIFHPIRDIFCSKHEYVCLFHCRVILDRVHLADDSELDQQDEIAGLRQQDTVPVLSLESQASVESVSQALPPHQDSDKRPPGTKEEVSDTLHRYGTCAYRGSQSSPSFVV